MSTSGSRGAAGAATVRKFPFAYNDVGLNAGKTIYVPTAGDILLDVWVAVTTAWDGFQPWCDVGTFVGSNAGFWGSTGGSLPLDMTQIDAVVPGAGETIGMAGPPASELGALVDNGKYNEAAGAGTPFTIGRIAALSTFSQIPRRMPVLLSATPIKVCVSLTGQAGGAAPGATHGAGNVYLVTATPI